MPKLERLQAAELRREDKAEALVGFMFEPAEYGKLIIEPDN